MKAEILSIGTELLLGQIDNVDASYLAGKLPPLGVDLYWISVVGDNHGRLTEALDRAWGRSDLIVTTGGLGPTEGDITREVIAGFLGEDLAVDPVLLQKVSAFFTSRNLEMPANNKKQAALIPSAQPMFNPLGTAPGWWIEKDRRILVTLPGPPHEMQLMWESEAGPRLHRHVCAIIFSRVIKTFGLGESKVDEMLSPFLGFANPTLATYAKIDGVQVRVTAKAADGDSARRMAAQREEQVYALLKDYIWGYDNDVIESVVGDMLAGRGLSMATVESYTSGGLAAMLGGVPANHRFFRGGAVINSEEAMAALGITMSSGYLGPENRAGLAEEMASAGRRLFCADVGVSITSAAERRENHVNNVHIAIDDGNRRRSLTRNYPSYLWLAKQRATYAALFELKRFLTQGGEKCT